MASPLTSPTRSAFFFYLSMAFLAIAVVGFSTTFVMPLARGSFTAPPVVHVHGALLFGWLAFFIAQTVFIRNRSLRFHRRAGWLGLLLAIAIVISGIAVGLFATRRDMATTVETWPIGNLVNIVIEMLLFGSLVVAAILSRRNPEAHKRYLVLATISALGPAWFRFRHFMPYVPNPIVTFSLIADAVLLVVIARDWVTLNRVHPVYVWAGGAMFAVHCIELACIGTPLWLTLGRGVLNAAS
jgi:hypothetical protein